MKKLISLVLVLCMMLMVGAAFATGDAGETQPETPSTPVNNLSVDTTISITGLIEGDVVDFYQVLKYDQTAEKGWSKTDDFSGLTDAQVTAILKSGISAELGGIIGNMVPDTATAAHYNVPATAAGVAEKKDPEAGLYVAIIAPADASTIYNPVFVGADYKTNNSGTWAVDTEMSYSDHARAKKSTVTVEKTANEYTHDHDDVVTFTIKTTIPEFAENYTNPMFKVNDTLSTGLVIQIDDSHPFTVTPAGAAFTGTPSSGDKTFTLNFNADYLKGLNANTEVTITYSAKITNEAPFNVNPETNDVTVQFSNNPDSNDDYGLLKDHTNHYTFSLDADILGHDKYEGSEVVKVGLDKDGNILTNTTTYDNGTTTSPLENAHFKLTTDRAGNDVYNNNLTNGADIVSDSEGKFNIKGLDAGTYYLTETTAPAGYVKSTSVYKIEIIADEHMSTTTVNETDSSTGKSIAVTYNTNILDKYEVKITELKADGTTGATTTSTFNMTNEGAETKSSSTTDLTSQIPNTQGVELPSTGGIGTTIFYVLGGLLVVGAAVILVARRKADN